MNCQNIVSHRKLFDTLNIVKPFHTAKGDKGTKVQRITENQRQYSKANFEKDTAIKYN